MRPFRASFSLICLLLATPGCGGSTPVGPEPLRLAAASDLRQSLPILVAAFRQTRKIEVEFSTASSGQLAEQIRQGAPFDVFLSANRAFVDRLATEGAVIPASVQPYARGSLVLAINPVFGQHPKDLGGLVDPKIKSIAIANYEQAPYGVAARQALERVGLWDTLKPKLVPAESVSQALQFVKSGSAEVGFVSRGLSDSPGLEFIPVPPSTHDPIDQYLGVVTRSTRQEDARAFAEFMTGSVGQAMLRDLGFSPVPASVVAPDTKSKPQ